MFYNRKTLRYYKFFWLGAFVGLLIITSGFLIKKYFNHPSSQPLLPTVKKNLPLPNLPPEVAYGSRNRHAVALTFDADMTPFMEQELKEGKVKSWYNKKIIDILEADKVPATIFMAGMWAETYPKDALSLAQNPLFEIANHSYSHPRFTSACYALPPVPIWGKEEEFKKSQEVIKNITGVTPRFFRFPGGCHSKSDTELAQKYDLKVIGWDVASGDSFNTNREQIIKNVENHTQNGSIILFHLHGNKNAPLTAEVLPEVLKFLKSQGYELVTLSDLLSS